MMTAEPMIARGAHYTALLDTIDHREATKDSTRTKADPQGPSDPRYPYLTRSSD